MPSIRLVLLIFLLSFLPGVAEAGAEEQPKPWVVYYTNQLPWEEFEQYHLLVFDADHHPDVRPLVGRDKLVLGYLSLMEVESYRSYFHRLKKQGLLLGASTPSGAEIVDIRDPRWLKVMVEEIIPVYVREGFNGLMLDTVDTAQAMEAADPVRYRGMQAAAAAVIRHIHLHYPYLKLMLNRGFSVLPYVQQDIHMVLAESIYADGRDKEPKLFPPEQYQEILGMLAEVRAANPGLQFYSLDYWNMKDTQGVKKIYEQQRKAGFIPYVSTRDLQAIYAEP